MDALADAGDLDYVLALQEATAVGAAEGYARVTGRPAFLNLHTSAGLGNAIGNLTNAQANRTPLVVTAGQQDYHHIVNDPLLSGDLVGIAALGVEVGARGAHARRDRHDHAPGVPRRRLPAGRAGLRVAAHGPARGGRRRRVPAADARSTRRAVADGSTSWPTCSPTCRRASWASSPATRWRHSGGVAALVALAEALGAPVHGASLHSTVGVPADAPALRRHLRPVGAGHRQGAGRLRQGAASSAPTAFVVYPYHPGAVVPPGVRAAAALARPGVPRAASTRPAWRCSAIRGPRSRRCCRWWRPGSTPPRSAGSSTSEARPPPALEQMEQRPSAATTPRRPSRWPPPTPCCGPAGRHAGRRRGHHHRVLRAALPPRRRRRTATSSARAAGWAGACRSRSACRSASAASRRCASSATGRPCTPARRCGPRPTATCRSCSPWSTTVST